MKVLRKCNECGLEAHTEEDLELFLVGSGRDKYKRRNKCKECGNKKKRETYGSKYHYKSRYGITEEEYNKCMATSVVCEVCGSDEDLCYDHDHDTGEFRGVLCRKHNMALGLLGDTLEGAYALYKYMKERS